MMQLKQNLYKIYGICLLFFFTIQAAAQSSPGRLNVKPNIVFIYADDLGYGDISCYGAKKIKTPNIDRVASQGIRFTNAHASSATCTPSRYSLLTGEYAWRKQGTGIAPGNAAALIQPGRTTLPSILQKAGYTTAAIGKWHLGLGKEGGPDWNGEINPGPMEIGFDYAFLMPATTDRVPCVYIENHRVLGLDPNDPVKVSYKEPIGNEPTGKEHPELLKMKASHGHDQTIINGIGRIGYMSGGKSAWWIDDEIAAVLSQKAISFIKKQQANPFFIYFATHDIHVPRVPNKQFIGKSGMGVRGDAILQLDWTVGEILKTLDSLQLTNKTMFIISSDNGPVLDDGYQDEAVAKLGGHKPAGPLRGGKYSAFDAGTRTPLIVCWPGNIKAGTSSNALISQVDLLASFAAFTGQQLPEDAAPDSFNMINVLLGKSKQGRDNLVEHAGTLALVSKNWKYIQPAPGPALAKEVNIELGNSKDPQLYDLSKDIGEQKNLAAANPEMVKEMSATLQNIKTKGRSRP
ncbi:MAG: arylsulfatase [Chitinophagaceae bacterium]